MSDETSEARRRGMLWRNYKMTLEEYDALLESNDGLCHFCGHLETSRNTRGDGVRPLSVEHRHDTGYVQALTCHSCNLIIGWAEKFRKDPALFAKCLAYLAEADGYSGNPELLTDDATSLLVEDAAQGGLSFGEYAAEHGIIIGSLAVRSAHLRARGRRLHEDVA